jgi:hypothetical protein
MEEKRAVLTLNRLDFHRLHRLTKGVHDGIVTCTRDPDSLALAQRIHQAETEVEGLGGKLVRVVREQRGHEADDGSGGRLSGAMRAAVKGKPSEVGFALHGPRNFSHRLTRISADGSERVTAGLFAVSPIL